MKKFLLLMLTLVMSVTSWAAEPYFEVLSGSFASGNVTLKITFPEATSVAVDGSVGLYHPENTPSYAAVAYAYDFYGDVTTDGNTLTATFRGFNYFSREIKYSVRSFDITVDGSTYDDEIYSKESLPVAEVVSDGGFTNGSVTIKVTMPRFETINSRNRTYTYAKLLDKGNQVSQVNGTNITTDGNTFSATFTLYTENDNIADYTIAVDANLLYLDGDENAWNNAFTIRLGEDDPTPDPSGCAHENLTHHDAVESTDLVQGNDAYDECDDCGACFATDDTEHENPLTAADFTLPLDEEPINYFFVQNEGDIDTDVRWGNDNISLQYSYDQIDWIPSTGTDPLPARGRIYYRATTSGNTFFGGGDTWSGIAVGDWQHRCHYSVGGDITTLLRSNGKVKTLPEPTFVDEFNGEDYDHVLRGVFENFFRGDAYGYLTAIFALDLPSTTLTERCYMNMFATNPGITGQGPKISAVTMASHSCESMFHGTEGLSWLPAMDVETMAEYSCAYMFAGCTELASVMMSPTTVAPHCCEMMFYDCRNLQSAPSLPATTLAEDCYKSMFYNCSSLQYVSELPAPYLVDGCYVQMFYGCINLQALSVGMQTEWPVRVTYNEQGGYNEYDYYCTRDWVAGVNTYGGIFTGNPSLFKNVYPGDYLYSTIPQNWDSSRRLYIDVNIGPAGYTTFCYDYNWEIPMGTEGYVGYVDESGEFHFEKAYGPRDIVQSTRRLYSTYVDGVGYVDQWVCKAVVLRGNPGSYNAILTEDDAEDVYDLDDPKAKNQLLGTMLDYDTSLYRSWDDDYYGWTDDNYYFYALSLDATGENVGFYWMLDDGAPFVTKPYKAFLRVKKELIDARPAFVFDDYEDTTGVTNVITPVEHKTEGIYDLSGRRLNNTAKRGLYIINGKKVVK